ncbi:MAG: class I SAM-dependent methyltransferase [Pseudomonadota bacterium]
MTSLPTILSCPAWDDYALIDSGDERKLERYGRVTVNRPDPQALWKPALSQDVWQRADAVFQNASDRDEDENGSWQTARGKNVPQSWPVTIDGITMQCQLMSFRHMGLFPEQRPHWQWMVKTIKESNRPLKILNLFGYTGAASLLAAKAGAEVTHLDASKKAIQWAKDNQAASNLTNAPIRWICDDAKAFVAREIRRGKTYDGILLDPPKFGRGPEGEVWRFETDINDFLVNCAALLSPQARFMIVTAYALRFSSAALGHVLYDAVARRHGQIDHGELWLEDQSGHRPLPTSLFARWTAKA